MLAAASRVPPPDVRPASDPASLILLLIQSDMLKAIVLVILPAVELVRGGPVASEAAICQASSFFLLVGFEACDVAVALVALHTALYIFRGRGGLHPYRRPAFALFLAVPLLLASLAFVNRPAFTNSGRYCHLPSKPRWPSLALNWVPRCLMLVAICFTYVATYLHVQVLMNRVGAIAHGGRLPAPPPTPPIAHHGLLSPTPSPPPPDEDPGSAADGSERIPAASMAADGHTMAHRRSSCDREELRALVAGSRDAAAWRSAGSDADPLLPVYRLGRCARSDLELACPGRRLDAAEPPSPGARTIPLKLPSMSSPRKPSWPSTLTAPAASLGAGAAPLPARPPRLLMIPRSGASSPASPTRSVCPTPV